MRPLDTVLVLALEHVIAAPFCARQLADLGAHTDALLRELGCADADRARLQEMGAA
jgi:crotonobetainyl-CoA:carnitine CoA-transferase CaiB-like acyl-CoA transferase